MSFRVSPMNFLKYCLDNELSAPTHTLDLDNGVRLEVLETGILRVHPNAQAADKPQYRVLISCGVHGNETAPIEMVETIFNEIKSSNLAVENELLLIIGNPPAINRAERFVDENLNRLFSGEHTGSDSQEAVRARLIEMHVEQFFSEGEEPRLHYDLHTAIRGSQFEKFAVYPYLHNRTWSKPQIAFLERCGLGAVLLSSQPSGTFSYYTSNRFGVDSFTIELGKVAKFGDNDMRKFSDAMQGLRDVISGRECFQAEAKSIKIFTVVEEVMKRSNELKFHFPEDAKNFTEFPKGSVLVSDQAYKYKTQCDGERFVFPIINVPVGQRAVLIVKPISI